MRKNHGEHKISQQLLQKFSIPTTIELVLEILKVKNHSSFGMLLRRVGMKEFATEKNSITLKDTLIQFILNFNFFTRGSSQSQSQNHIWNSRLTKHKRPREYFSQFYKTTKDVPNFAAHIKRSKLKEEGEGDIRIRAFTQLNDRTVTIYLSSGKIIKLKPVSEYKSPKALAILFLNF